jgi:hypothetical protein
MGTWMHAWAVTSLPFQNNPLVRYVCRGLEQQSASSVGVWVMTAGYNGRDGDSEHGFSITGWSSWLPRQLVPYWGVVKGWYHWSFSRINCTEVAVDGDTVDCAKDGTELQAFQRECTALRSNTVLVNRCRGLWRLIRKPVLWQQVSHLLHKYTESVLTAACARQGCSATEWVSELFLFLHSCM